MNTVLEETLQQCIAPCQASNTHERLGLVTIRQALKRGLVEWHARGIMPEEYVEQMFGAVDLREV